MIVVLLPGDMRHLLLLSNSADGEIIMVHQGGEVLPLCLYLFDIMKMVIAFKSRRGLPSVLDQRGYSHLKHTLPINVNVSLGKIGGLLGQLLEPSSGDFSHADQLVPYLVVEVTSIHFALLLHFNSAFVKYFVDVSIM
jgi:hypothetical protein